MTHRGIVGSRYTHEDKVHILLLTKGEDECYHFFHLTDGSVVRRINFGQDPLMAKMDYQQEVRIFEEWVRNGP